MTSANPKKSSSRSLIRVLLHTGSTRVVSPPYFIAFRTMRPRASGYSMARQKGKFSTPQVTHLASQNLPAQDCTKSDWIWTLRQTQHRTGRNHPCQTSTVHYHRCLELKFPTT